MDSFTSPLSALLCKRQLNYTTDTISSRTLDCFLLPQSELLLQQLLVQFCSLVSQEGSVLNSSSDTLYNRFNAP